MRRLPNVTHSNLLTELCENFSLTDPYRSLYPDRREYTYIPRNDARTNKSRLDFFLVTNLLSDVTTDCIISEGLQNKLFDHKAVCLMLNASVTTETKSERRMPAISNKDLDDDLLEFVVLTSAAETYLQNTDAIVIGNHNKIHLLQTCGSIKNFIRICGPPCHLTLG
jgi:hypothetical protein